MAQDHASGIAVYSPRARLYHWLTAFLVFIQIPIGLYMTYRGTEMTYVDAEGATKVGLFDATTGFLYDFHKTIGITILTLVLARLIYRLRNGAPAADPSVPPALIGVSHLTHWSIYALLVAVPLVGYIGTSYYGALSVFGLPLLAVTAKDEKFSETVFEWHETLAFALLALIAIHIAAAIYHKLIRKDRVVERMLPKRTV
jgi:cytochrome b561